MYAALLMLLAMLATDEDSTVQNDLNTRKKELFLSIRSILCSYWATRYVPEQTNFWQVYQNLPKCYQWCGAQHT